MGYTETTCNGGKGVKCPFGNKWACLGANEEEVRNKLCQELGFTLTCTGTGYAGGAGSACGGKYAQCTCASGYEWKDGSCQQQVLDGAVGNLYYCNGSVVAVKAPGMSFYVTMEDLGEKNWSYANISCQNYSPCKTLKGMLPTLDQLETMYNNKSLLNSLLSANGGTVLRENRYWSSTLFGPGGSSGTTRYRMDMSDGYATNSYDYNSYYVRPVLVNY